MYESFVTFNKQEVRDSILEECEPTLEHVMVHIKSAMKSEEVRDLHQLAHDVHVAGRLLLILCWNTEQREDYDD